MRLQPKGIETTYRNMSYTERCWVRNSTDSNWITSGIISFAENNAC